MAEERAQRRLAAILAADVVGYSHLMEQDEAGTMAALAERRKTVWEPLLAKYHGRVVRLMGDGTLAEFASAVDAVQCAVDVQKAMKEANANLPDERAIVVRVGLNLGDVIVEDGDLFGDGVNVAARLEAMADPGSICLSAAIHQQVERLLPLAFKDLGDQALKNIGRPVRVYSISEGDEEVVATRRAGAQTRSASSAAIPPSIAVLPFANMSGDPEQEYFSDGITEDIITELTRFRNLLVIARNSSFAYKGKSVSIGTIARELGVEYVLEGSVRRVGQRVRITAQLIDAASSNHVWAERYDRDLIDIFAVQDEVTSSIVGALAVELEEESIAQARQKPPGSLQAYDHWLRGKRLIFLMGENNLEARRHFERAIALDPNYSRAHSGLALTYQMEALDFPLPPDFRAAYDKSFQFAQRALLLDETNHQAHLSLAYVYLYRREYDQARKHIDRAIRLNPSDGDTLSHAAYFMAMVGAPEEGIKLGEAAMRLNPHHPDWYLVFLSTALFTARRYPEAQALRSRAPDAFIDSPFIGAATLAHMGRLGEAKRWADMAVAKLARTAGGALAIAEGRVVGLLLENNPYCRQEDRDHFAEGMRMAGVPG